MLKHKARNNLRAGEALAALGLPDPAASRYYYALYQAAVHALTLRGWTPGRIQSGAIEWSHVVVMNNAFLTRGRRADRGLFEIMRELRTRADYEDKSIESEFLGAQVDAVRAFVEEVTA